MKYIYQNITKKMIIKIFSLEYLPINFHQDGHHSAVALLLKAALIHVSDYRLLGASCL
jgi:hypothetical protein